VTRAKWWPITPNGSDFASSGNLLWGDEVTDIMDEALNQIFLEFVEIQGRKPTQPELIAGLLFSLSGFEEKHPAPRTNVVPLVRREKKGRK
jgi:hypothetical protein